MDVTSQNGYDSNISRRPDGQENDGVVLRLRPRASLSDEDAEARTSYLLSYAPSATWYPQYDNASSIDHFAQVKGSYGFSPRTRVEAEDHVVRRKNITRDLFTANRPDQVDVGDRWVTINNASMTFSHLFTPRLTGVATAEHGMYRFDKSVDADSDRLTGTAQMSYAFTPHFSAGTGFVTTYRSFEKTQFTREVPSGSGMFLDITTPGGHSSSYNGFLSFVYRPSQTLELVGRGGPAYIESSSLVCDNLTFDPTCSARSKTRYRTTTFFGSGELRKSWKNLSTALRYRRSEGLATGSAQSSVVDQLTLSTAWQPGRLWRMRWRGSWQQRKTNRPQQSNSTTTIWNATAEIRRILTEHLSLTLEGTYRDQSVDGVSNTNSFTLWRITAGAYYRFDPIRF